MQSGSKNHWRRMQDLVPGQLSPEERPAGKELLAVRQQGTEPADGGALRARGPRPDHGPADGSELDDGGVPAGTHHNKRRLRCQKIDSVSQPASESPYTGGLDMWRPGSAENCVCSVH